MKFKKVFFHYSAPAKWLSIIFFVAIGSEVAFSNGGPVDWSNICKINRIKLLNQSEVKLQKEVLGIVIRNDYSDIRVQYTLTNLNRSKAVHVDYGFPVDFNAEGEVDDFQPKWDTSMVKKFIMTLDKSKLRIQEYVDTGTYAYRIVNKHGEFSDTYKRNWFLTGFKIPKNSSVVLEISFTLKNSFVDYEYTKNFFTEYSDRTIRYDLSPARFWGDSTIGDFSVNIDARNVIENDGSIEISGIPFGKSDNGLYTYEKKNFQITENCFLSIVYTADIRKRSEEIRKNLIPPNRIRVSASSTLKGNYLAKNMIDRDFSTAWVEGKENDGVGEWIEFELDHCSIGAIGILNGYWKSKNTLEENSRPRKISVMIEYLDEDQKKPIRETETIDLPNSSYCILNQKNFSKRVDIIKDFGDGSPEVTKVRITILDVWKGSKYKDTAVSEIFFIGKAK